MRDSDIIELLKTNVAEWNAWKLENMYKRIDLPGVDLSGADLKGAILLGLNLKEAKMAGANLEGANLRGAYLLGADLQEVNLSEANLSGANLYGAFLTKAKLTYANLQGCIMNAVHLYRADLQGANLYGCSLDGANLQVTYMQDANMEKAELRGASLQVAFMQGVNLADANLQNANLQGANLQNALFNSASLQGANLQTTKLINTHLNGANLQGANFTRANLDKTNFNNAFIGNTIFGLTDLSTTTGLDTIKVSGDCIIDFNTLKKSADLPSEFLFKIGLPEKFIDFLQNAQTGNSTRFYPVFISHAHEDKAFAVKLYEALIDRKIQVWFDQRALLPGDDIRKEIAKGINTFDKFIIICSENSLNDSWWVEEEINRALKKKEKLFKKTKQHIDTIIPITIDNFVFDKWKSELKENLDRYVIGDFRNWENDEIFNNALEKLITSLNVDRPDDEVSSFLPKL